MQERESIFKETRKREEREEIEFLDWMQEISDKIQSLRKNINFETETYFERKKELEKEMIRETKDDPEKISFIKVLFGIDDVIERQKLRRTLEGKKDVNLAEEDAAWQGYAVKFILANREDTDTLQDFWGHYDFLFTRRDEDKLAQEQKSGILGVVAAARFFNKKNMKVILSRPKEDAEKKIDLLVIPHERKRDSQISPEKENLILALQIKCRSVNPEEKLIKVFKGDISYSTEDSTEENDFRKGCKKFAEEIKRNVLGLFITIPRNIYYGGKFISLLDEETGILNEKGQKLLELAIDREEEIKLIKR